MRLIRVCVLDMNTKQLLTVGEGPGRRTLGGEINEKGQKGCEQATRCSEKETGLKIDQERLEIVWKG